MVEDYEDVSLMRQYQKQAVRKNIYCYKDMILHTKEKYVVIRGVEVILTTKEYEILELLLENPGRVYTKVDLYELLWHQYCSGADYAIKTHISNLRNKLKKLNPTQDYIETVWGLGYRLKQDDSI